MRTRTAALALSGAVEQSDQIDVLPGPHFTLDGASPDRAVAKGETLGEVKLNAEIATALAASGADIDKARLELTSASEGVRVVYRAIGWGVVLLAGVGILVVQLVIVRGRMWLFGLARALGARAGHVVVLVLGESVVAVLLGGLGAAALALTTQPWISRLSQEYFDAPAELWNAQSATTFSVALAGILILSSALPVRRALAADPLDTLEGRS